ncbi:hypothetical protein OU995_08290 [Roseateles sp. SL47]|uniref:hypothetical protein n=1 Tax=Roseateles sp. SL47 TaxID=2995138 RepID=UPI00226DA09B|nr:hypothetical protein [Roseateles sp. SL47]WAC74685.1 hypothetical protein OU995_08290 [Roseateles sp. SL47]
MRLGRSLMRGVFFAVCLVGCSAGAETSRMVMNCTHDVTKQLSYSLKLGTLFEPVVAKLDASKFEYMIFSGDLRISLESIRSAGVYAVAPIHVLVKSSTSPKGQIQEDEILTLSFDRGGSLTEKSCKRVFTGP